MKRTKKLLVGLLAALSVFSGTLFLAACQDGSGISSSGNGSNAEQSSSSNVSSGQNNSSGDETGTFSQGLKYTLLADDTYAVTGIGECKDTELVIPSRYNKKTVTSIGDSAFYDCSSLTSIVIPDSVTSIDNLAFYNCSSLTSIEIPDSVISIGAWAIYNCSALKSITIGGSVTSIGIGAFSACVSLTSITVEENNANYISIDGNLYTKDGTTLIQYAIGKKDTSFVVPNGVIFIGEDAFRGCISLTSIEISDGVTSIGDWAFSNCSSLTDIVIPDGVTSIGDWAFFGCSGLTSIEIPEKVTSIGAGAFGYCSSLTSMEIPDSVTSIGDAAFHYCDSLTSMEIPDSVTSIGDAAFAYCMGLTGVTMGNGVTSIGDRAFINCRSLKSIVIPNSVTSIGYAAFADCTALTEINYNARECADLSDHNDVFSFAGQSGEGITVKIGAKVKNIPAYLFYPYGISSAPKIKTVAFEKNSVCKSIGFSAFYGCDSLTSIEIPENVTSIGRYAFYNCTALTEIHYNARECADLTSSNNVFSFAGQNGDGITVKIGAKVKKIPAYLFYPYNGSSYAPKIKTAAFEEGSVCKSIGVSAFRGCDSLTSIEIPEKVTSIGDSALYNCGSLTSVTIGGDVTSIGDSAFYGCSNLTEIKYNATGCADLSSSNNAFSFAGQNGDGITVKIGANVKKIPAYLFYPYSGSSYAPKIKTVAFEEGSVCESIGVSSFRGCDSLTSIEIPDKVTSIGDYAFSNCYKLVEVVNKSADITINKGRNSNGYVGYYALAVYNSGDKFTETKLSNDNGYIVYTDGEEKILVGYTGAETELTLPSDITKIYQYAFRGCDSLTSIAIPNSVTSIDNSAFRACDSLTSVTIGGGVTSIGNSAFYGCKSLTSIEIPEAVTSIGNSAFYGCKSLTEINVNESNTAYKDIDGNLYTKDGTTLVQYAIGKTADSFAVPNTVTSIGNSAFYGCDNLTSVTIGDSVTSIGKFAFHSCSNLEEINYNAIECADFGYAHNVFYNAGQSGEGITVKIGANVKKIPAYLFCLYGSNSYALKITTVTFEEGSVCESIGSSSFRGCDSLTSIVIPDSVTSIGESAFFGCENLTNITFNGTVDEWNAISKGDGWNDDVPAEKVVCSDGEVSLQEDNRE